eukprot:5317016-Amphidinium_carterae.1
MHAQSIDSRVYLRAVIMAGNCMPWVLPYGELPVETRAAKPKQRARSSAAHGRVAHDRHVTNSMPAPRQHDAHASQGRPQLNFRVQGQYDDALARKSSSLVPSHLRVRHDDSESGYVALVDQQRAKLPSALKELEMYGRKSMGHWAWYAFPTEM